MSINDVIDLLQREYNYTYEEAKEYIAEWGEIFKKELEEQEIKDK